MASARDVVRGPSGETHCVDVDPQNAPAAGVLSQSTEPGPEPTLARVADTSVVATPRAEPGGEARGWMSFLRASRRSGQRLPRLVVIESLAIGLVDIRRGTRM